MVSSILQDYIMAQHDSDSDILESNNENDYSKENQGFLDQATVMIEPVVSMTMLA